jgi:hypothetical protein
MTVKLPDVSEFQSPASGNAPNWAGIKSQNGGAAIIRAGYGNAHLDGMFGVEPCGDQIAEVRVLRHVSVPAGGSGCTLAGQCIHQLGWPEP